MGKQLGLPLPVALIVAGLWVLWGFGYQTVLNRLLIAENGVITASVDAPYKGAPRYASYYTIRSEDGHELSYTAGATDASLERSLPVGTRLRKNRWELGYEINGRQVSFPTGFYGSILVAALVAVVVGIFRLPAWCRSL